MKGGRGMEERKLIVVFPGRNYSVDMPLLYYANFKYEVRGYESIKVDYSRAYKEGQTFDEYMERAKKMVWDELSRVDFSLYRDVVFVSKSMGTVIAGWLEEQLGMKVRHIYLTPLKETLPYMTQKQEIIHVLAGTRDKFLDAAVLREHCEKEMIRLEQIEGVGHSLEMWGSMESNIDILKRVVELY